MHQGFLPVWVFERSIAVLLPAQAFEHRGSEVLKARRRSERLDADPYGPALQTLQELPFAPRQLQTWSRRTNLAEPSRAQCRWAKAPDPV
jgi:hypothetical protein